jgi:hypothetical protein
VGKKEAIRIAAELGNHTAVEFTGGIVHGFIAIQTDDFIMGGVFPMYGFLWKITKIDSTKELPLVTLQCLREVA